MRFKGTFAIRAFKEAEKRRPALLKEQRNLFQQAYLSAIGSALLNYGQRIPVLTGDTRDGVKIILKEIDMRNQRAGANTSFASALDSQTMTLAKESTMDEPQPGDRQYKSWFYWPPHSKANKVKSRSDWAAAIEAAGHHPGGKASDTDYALTVNSYIGYYTFYFAHGEGYWAGYDQSSKYGRGPWNLSEVFDREVQAVLEGNIREAADAFAAGLVRFQTGLNIRLNKDIATRSAAPAHVIATFQNVFDDASAFDLYALGD